MAVIDSKKLLPSGNPGGKIVESQKPFLVPISNVLYKKDLSISKKLLLPEKRDQVDGSLVIVKEKIIKIEDLIKSSIIISEKEKIRKRKEEEREKFRERERSLEKKPERVDEKGVAKFSIPGKSILDTINRFLGFTLLGFLFDKYKEFLPKIVEFGKYIEPVAKFAETFGKNAIDGVINFIDLGYKTYDKIEETIKKLGGDDAEKSFQELSGNLNKLINGTLMFATLIASTSPKGAAGAGVGSSASRTLATAAGKQTGSFGSGTAMTPGRYRLPGQAKAGGFALEQARKKATQTSLNQASKQLATQGAKQSLRSLVAVPIVGSLIGFIIDTVVFREKPTRAAAGAIGSAIGQGIGIALAGSTTFGLGAGIGMFVGGFAGDWLGKTIYDAINGYQPDPIPAKAQGGQVSTNRQSNVSAQRRIKKSRKVVPKSYTPSKTEPGKDIGGKLRIENLYGKDEPGKRSALRALTKSSADLKQMKSMQGVVGGMFGAGIDMALGQKPNQKLADSLGNMFGSVIEAAVNSELNSSFNDITKSIAMANGGVVPSREIGSGISIGEKIGRYISNAFSIALGSSASKVLQNLNRELNLEGAPPGISPDDIGDGGPITQDQQEAFEKIRKIAEKVGSPNPSVTAAIAMLETGWLSNPNSVYFASGKTNPFGQTGRGSKGSVIGKDGQEHAVYNNLEEGVKAHVDRWKSSYIGKTPQEIIESIRTGRGAGAPGMYNVSPSWTAKVLSTFQSGTQPKPSGVPTKGSFASVLPRGNPQFSSGFGSRWGRQHRGIDIGVDANSPVTALADGKVVAILDNFGGHGVGISVQHSDGTRIVYGHVNKASGIRVGSPVKKGQIIATVKGWYNAYGNKDNTHLHLERYVGGVAQDPTGYLNSLVPKTKTKPDTRPASPPPPQVRTKLTRKDQWKPEDSGLKLNPKTGQYEKASLAPIQTSKDIASLQTMPQYTLIENNTIAFVPLVSA